MRGVYFKEGEFYMAQFSDYDVFKTKLRARMRRRYFCFYQYGGPENELRCAMEFREQKMKENAEFRKKFSLQHRGRSYDGNPLEAVSTNSFRRKSPNSDGLESKRFVRDYSGMDSEAAKQKKKEVREEGARLWTQRVQLNSTRTEADRFHGHYKAEECARLPDLKHHCEEYLIATTERSKKDEVLNDYRHLKDHYRKKLAKQKPKPKRKPQNAPGKKRYLRNYSGMDPETNKRHPAQNFEQGSCRSRPVPWHFQGGGMCNEA